MNSHKVLFVVACLLVGSVCFGDACFDNLPYSITTGHIGNGWYEGSTSFHLDDLDDTERYWVKPTEFYNVDYVYVWNKGDEEAWLAPGEISSYSNGITHCSKGDDDSGAYTLTLYEDDVSDVLKIYIHDYAGRELWAGLVDSDGVFQVWGPEEGTYKIKGIVDRNNVYISKKHVRLAADKVNTVHLVREKEVAASD